MLNTDKSRLVADGKRSQHFDTGSPSALIHIHIYNLLIFGFTEFLPFDIYRLESHSSRLGRFSSLVVVVIVTVIVGGALV